MARFTASSPGGGVHSALLNGGLWTRAPAKDSHITAAGAWCRPALWPSANDGRRSGAGRLTVRHTGVRSCVPAAVHGAGFACCGRVLSVRLLPFVWVGCASSLRW